MKKKILSLLLCVLFVLPFAAPAAADSNVSFGNIGTITKDDYHSSAVIVLLATKLPEIKIYPGRDCFEAYGMQLSAIEVYTESDAYDASDDIKASALIALSQNDDEIFVRLKLANSSDIAYVSEAAVNHPDIVAYDVYVEYPGIFVEGDINQNGTLDARDYAIVKRYCLNTFYLYDWEIQRGDMNGDGVLDVQDYMLIKRMVMGTYIPVRLEHIL